MARRKEGGRKRRRASGGFSKEDFFKRTSNDERSINCGVYLFFMPDAISKSSSSVLSRWQEALMENKKTLDATKFYQDWGRRKKA